MATQDWQPLYLKLYTNIFPHYVCTLQGLWGHQAEGLHFMGHWHVCGWLGGEHYEEPTQGAPSVHTGPGEEILSHKIPIPPLNVRLTNSNFAVLRSSHRGCMESRMRSSWASRACWATAASQMWSTWRWSPRRRSSWWRAPRPCGGCRRSSPCEEHSSENEAQCCMVTSPLLNLPRQNGRTRPPIKPPIKDEF